MKSNYGEYTVPAPRPRFEMGPGVKILLALYIAILIWFVFAGDAVVALLALSGGSFAKVWTLWTAALVSTNVGELVGAVFLTLFAVRLVENTLRKWSFWGLLACCVPAASAVCTVVLASGSTAVLPLAAGMAALGAVLHLYRRQHFRLFGLMEVRCEFLVAGVLLLGCIPLFLQGMRAAGVANLAAAAAGYGLIRLFEAIDRNRAGSEKKENRKFSHIELD